MIRYINYLRHKSLTPWFLPHQPLLLPKNLTPPPQHFKGSTNPRRCPCKTKKNQQEAHQSLTILSYPKRKPSILGIYNSYSKAGPHSSQKPFKTRSPRRTKSVKTPSRDQFSKCSKCSESAPKVALRSPSLSRALLVSLILSRIKPEEVEPDLALDERRLSPIFLSQRKSSQIWPLTRADFRRFSSPELCQRKTSQISPSPGLRLKKSSQISSLREPTSAGPNSRSFQVPHDRCKFQFFTFSSAPLIPLPSQCAHTQK